MTTLWTRVVQAVGVPPRLCPPPDAVAQVRWAGATGEVPAVTRWARALPALGAVIPTDAATGMLWTVVSADEGLVHQPDRLSALANDAARLRESMLPLTPEARAFASWVHGGASGAPVVHVPRELAGCVAWGVRFDEAVAWTITMAATPPVPVAVWLDPDEPGPTPALALVPAAYAPERLRFPWLAL